MLCCDACAANGAVGVRTPDGTNGFSSEVPSVLMAGYRTTSFAQQTAELYGAALAVAMSALGQQNLLLLTDSSACVGWFSGLRLPPNKQQAKLLLAAAVLQTLFGVAATLRWVPSEANPADSWSRVALNPHGP